MDHSGQFRRISEAGPEMPEIASAARNDRGLMMHFESLGGSGHGPEFAAVQQHFGAKPDGLLAWADLGYDLLVGALESRFNGVGLEENTIVFAPDHSDEWWTKDKRYWMAMRSFIRTDHVDAGEVAAEACQRLQSLRRKLIGDLEAGEKIFVFKNMHRNLDEAEINRLHAAIRAYGNPTLFYVRYADESHPAGTVAAAAPSLLIGYIDHFAYSPDNEPIGPVDGSWLALCEQAYQRHQPQLVETAARTIETVAGTDDAAVPRHIPPRRGRQIVLIGNCQMQAMAGLYKRFVSGRSGDIVEHVASYQDLTDENRATIQRADVVVEQLFDLKQQADTDALATTTPRIFIPMVTAAFLWPFAGSPHPKNTGHPFLTGGPYGGEASDSYLNRLIVSGVDPEEAVETYANLDVNSRVNLNRLFEIVMDRQRSRDEAAGYQIADIVEQHFRTEQVFLSPYHPNVRVAIALASQLFEQLGAERSEIGRMQDCTRITPFPKGELPLHPSVCRHFGLDYVTPDRRYPFLNEGTFTFREYALRYMRYEWNDALEEGMYLSQQGKLQEARERLAVGVLRSPLSGAAYNALGHVLNRQGAYDEAVVALRRAVKLDPQAAAYHANLGTLLRQQRQLDEAMTELRAAVAASPTDPHYRVLLAHLLRQRGDGDAACEIVRDAIRLDPYAAGLHAELAGSLEAKGDLAAAVASLQHAVATDPADEGLHLRLAQLLGRLNRLDEAIDIARAAITLAPASTRARVVLSDLLLRNGDLTDALNEAYTAAISEPDSAHAYDHLGHVLQLVGDLPAAEAAYRRAAKLEPRNAHFRHGISVVLTRQERFEEAITAAREAANLEARNPHRLVHLANLLTQRGDLAAARAELRGAVDLEPEVASFRIALSDLFARNQQLDEAMTEVALAVEFNPDSVHALGQLAHVQELRGELDQAQQTLRRALEIDPRNDNLLRRATSLQTRKRRVLVG
jgi:tetratricopeptide (TPR) repeat protein